jgi:rfaE bifunctional protein nucleotidyltransferase chain/domain
LPRPIVFTNGCFDILHRGHVTYLAQARALGASLVLGLNTDASVKRQGKGDDRPINNELNRAAVLAALESVSLVTWFDSDTPAALIELVQPDVLVKGGDWTVDKIVGSAETLARGGKCIPFPSCLPPPPRKPSTRSVLPRTRRERACICRAAAVE